MTVTGPIEADQLGFTLVHEHLFYGTSIERGETWSGGQTGTYGDTELTYDALMRFKGVGGATVVDQTTGGLCGRNGEVLLDQSTQPVKRCMAVRQMSERTGINIIQGTGWYRVPFYEPYLYEIKVDQLAEELVIDITEGLHGTDVKAGLLGEIGVEQPSWIWPVEERMLRAVARAQIRTGVTIATHAVAGPVGLDQLDILMEEGVDPGRIIIGHVTLHLNHKYHAEIARRGAFMSFDTLKGGRWLLRHQMELEHIQMALEAGLIGHILLSHDISGRTGHAVYGGGGFEHISTTFLDRFRGIGGTDEQFRQMTVDNPRRALSGER